MCLNKRNIFFSLLVLLLFTGCVNAQQSADKIIAVVGRDIILQSELDQMVQQARQQNPNFTDANRCDILEDIIRAKMLEIQAERDSVIVSDDDVEGTLENRIRYFIQMYGSKEKLEQMSGKTVYQLKDEYRESIKKQMVAEKMRNQILENTKVTPAEVDRFYKKIPVDSLPFFPSTVEVGQIVVDPPVSQEMNDYAKTTLEGYRKNILDEYRKDTNSGNKAFEYHVATRSEDPGSKDNGGRYDGITRNGAWAPEFVAATFRLQNGEISPVFKTKFGYHIVQMIQRKGDEADVRHILIKPQVTSADFEKAMKKLDSIRTLLVNKKITFPEAVGKYSTDEAAKRTGGMIADPQTGNTELDMTKLDPGMVILLDSLKQGDFSAPHIFVTDAREKSCRIVYLRSRTAPHKVNMKDDYSKLQELALYQKKNDKMNQWIIDKLNTFYLKVAPEYQDCKNIRSWILVTGAK